MSEQLSITSRVVHAHLPYIQFGRKVEQGGRLNVEDFSFVDRIPTLGKLQDEEHRNLELIVGIVADGVGGGNKGEWAAAQVIQQVRNRIETSKAVDNRFIPSLLEVSLIEANNVVYDKSVGDEVYRGTASTATIATIDQATNKLYIANVGDSRAYLIRSAGEKQTLHQLTADHTYAWEMSEVLKRLTAKAASEHVKAEELVRAVGEPPDEFEVDLGLYYDPVRVADASLPNKVAYNEAESYQGLDLQSGDVIVICSDGLIKPRHNNASLPYVTDEELIEIATTRPAQQAADELTRLAAVTRQADDNVTAVVIQLDGPTQPYIPPSPPESPLVTWAKSRQGQMILGGFAAVILLFLLVRLFPNDQSASDTVAEMPVAQVVVPTSEPTPTDTPFPTIAPDLRAEPGCLLISAVDLSQVQVTSSNQESLALVNGKQICGVNGYEVASNVAGTKIHLQDETRLHLGAGTSLLFAVSDTLEVRPIIKSGKVLVDRRGIESEEDLDIGRNGLGGVVKLSHKSLAGVMLGQDEDDLNSLIVDCFIETCTLREDEELMLSGRQQAKLQVNGVPSAPTEVVREEWISIAPVGILPAPPAATAEPAETATAVPSNTPEPTETIQAIQNPTVTPRRTNTPWPTSTPNWVQTNAPDWQATNVILTQKAPTATPVATSTAPPTRKPPPTWTPSVPAPTPTPSCGPHVITTDPDGDADDDQKLNQHDKAEFGLDPCNPDSDGDGIIDGLDQCPSTAGTGAGCPGDSGDAGSDEVDEGGSPTD